MTDAPQSHGTRFESQIGAMYESLGYRVRRDELVDGQQVDLIAEKYIIGTGLTKLLIECKFLSEGSVSNQVVQDFVAMFASIGLHNGFSAGVLVTNRSFTRNAKAAAARHPIYLRRSVDLQSEALNAQDVAHALVREYEQSELHRHYVPLAARGELRGSHASLEERNLYAPRANSLAVDSDLVDWIGEGQPSFVTIFGDFGAGKTSLLTRVRYLLAKKMIESSECVSPTPIYFPLGELGRFPDLDSYVAAMTSRELRHSVPLATFWHQLANGGIVPLLDGLDEALPKSDPVSRQSLFEKISPLITRCGGVAVLTSRETLFPDHNEYRTLLSEFGDPPRDGNSGIVTSEDDGISQLQIGLDQVKRRLSKKFLANRAADTKQRFTSVLRLQVFDERQITAYLQSHNGEILSATGKNWDEVHQFLRRVYDLSDLMTRPFLLEMITATLLTGALRIDDEVTIVGASSLYEIYTNIQLTREHESKNRSLFTPGERQAFAQLVALGMQNEGFDGIRPEALQRLADQRPDQFASLLGRATAISEAELATDIRICTFLTLEDDGRLRFAHKSFVEFFLARQIRGSLAHGTAEPLLASSLSAEVLYFLGSFAGVDESLQRQLLGLVADLQGDQSKTLHIRQNSFAALCYMVSELNGASLYSVQASNLRFPTIRWRSVSAQYVRLDSCSIRGITASNSEVLDVTLLRDEIGSIHLRSTSGNLRVVETRAQSIVMDEKCSVELRGDNAVVQAMEVIESRVALTARMRFGEISVRDGVLEFLEPSPECGIGSLSMTRSTLLFLRGAARRKLEVGQLTCVEARLFGLVADEAVNLTLLSKEKRIELQPQFRGCLGLLLVDEVNDELLNAVSTLEQCEGFILLNLTAYRKRAEIRQEADKLLSSMFSGADQQIARRVLAHNCAAQAPR